MQIQIFVQIQFCKQTREDQIAGRRLRIDSDFFERGEETNGSGMSEWEMGRRAFVLECVHDGADREDSVWLIFPVSRGR